MGRLAWVLLIRTFLWLLLTAASRGWPLLVQEADGDAGSRARHRPSTPLAFLISVVSSGADC